MGTKLGVSVGLVAAGAFFSYILSGFTVLTLIIGYVLIAEENVWLKSTVLKAGVLAISISALECIIGLIPDSLGAVSNIISIFDGSFNYSIITTITRALLSVIAIIEKLLFLGLGFKALKQSTINISQVDSIVEKYFTNNK